MAKLLFTAFLADARNKLNGSVFSRNRYGSYVRTRVTPANPQTPAQQAARQAFGSFSSDWRTLTDGERNAWAGAAQNFPVVDAFGNPKVLSGNALFVSLNRNRALAGQAALTTPPLPVEVPTISNLTAQFSIEAGPALDGGVTFDLPNPLPSPCTVIVRATPPLSPGISYFSNRLRILATQAGASGANSVDLSAAYTAAFGLPPVGQRIGVEVYIIVNGTGQSGVAVRASALVASA